MHPVLQFLTGLVTETEAQLAYVSYAAQALGGGKATMAVHAETLGATLAPAVAAQLATAVAAALAFEQALAAAPATHPAYL